MKWPFNTDVWMPMSLLPPEVLNAAERPARFQVIGRLAPGHDGPGPSELTTISAALAHDYPDTNKDFVRR